MILNINKLSVSLCLPRNVSKWEDVEIIVCKTFLFLNTECQFTFAPPCILLLLPHSSRPDIFLRTLFSNALNTSPFPYGKVRQLQPTALPHNSLRIRLEGPHLSIYIYIYWKDGDGRGNWINHTAVIHKHKLRCKYNWIATRQEAALNSIKHKYCFFYCLLPFKSDEL